MSLNVIGGGYATEPVTEKLVLRPAWHHPTARLTASLGSPPRAWTSLEGHQRWPPDEHEHEHEHEHDPLDRSACQAYKITSGQLVPALRNFAAADTSGAAGLTVGLSQPEPPSVRSWSRWRRLASSGLVPGGRRVSGVRLPRAFVYGILARRGSTVVPSATAAGFVEPVLVASAGRLPRGGRVGAIRAAFGKNSASNSV